MEEKSIQNKWKIIAIIFIILFIIGSIGFLINFYGYNQAMRSYRSCQNQSLEISNMYEKEISEYLSNYSKKCPEGTNQKCINKTNEIVIYNPKNEHVITWDYNDSTAIECKKINNERALCLDREAYAIKCPEGGTPGCLNNLGEYAPTQILRVPYKREI